MKKTANEFYNYVKAELRCPVEYLQHLRKFGTFSKLRDADAVGNDEFNEMMDELRQGYKDYCKDCGLDPAEDNRKARPGYFIR